MKKKRRHRWPRKDNNLGKFFVFLRKKHIHTYLNAMLMLLLVLLLVSVKMKTKTAFITHFALSNTASMSLHSHLPCEIKNTREYCTTKKDTISWCTLWKWSEKKTSTFILLYFKWKYHRWLFNDWDTYGHPMNFSMLMWIFS